MLGGLSLVVLGRRNVLAAEDAVEIPGDLAD